MGQFSVEKPVAPGSALSGNQHLLGVAVHRLVFGRAPASDADDLPPEWSSSIDPEGQYAELHVWFETALSFIPKDRFPDATAALDAFNKAIAARPTPREVLEGLEAFRSGIRSQKNLFAAYPESKSIRESDRLDIWKSEGQTVISSSKCGSAPHGVTKFAKAHASSTFS